MIKVNLVQDSEDSSFASFSSENWQVIKESIEEIEFLLKSNCFEHYGNVSD